MIFPRFSRLFIFYKTNFDAHPIAIFSRTLIGCFTIGKQEYYYENGNVIIKIINKKSKNKNSGLVFLINE